MTMMTMTMMQRRTRLLWLQRQSAKAHSRLLGWPAVSVSALAWVFLLAAFLASALLLG